VAGAVGGLIAAGFNAEPTVVVLSGIAMFVLAALAMVLWLSRSVRQLTPGLEARFPSPPE